MTTIGITALVLGCISGYCSIVGIVYKLNLQLGIRNEKEMTHEFGPAKFRSLFWPIWVPVLIGIAIVSLPVRVAARIRAWRASRVPVPPTPGGPFRTSALPTEALTSKRGVNPYLVVSVAALMGLSFGVGGLLEHRNCATRRLVEVGKDCPGWIVQQGAPGAIHCFCKRF